MKAFAITGLGETSFVDVAEPVVGPGEVLLEVKYIGYCGSDLNTYRGLNPLVRLPRVPGHEISAVVAEKGAGVPEAWRGHFPYSLSVLRCPPSPSLLNRGQLRRSYCLLPIQRAQRSYSRKTGLLAYP